MLLHCQCSAGRHESVHLVRWHVRRHQQHARLSNLCRVCYTDQTVHQPCLTPKHFLARFNSCQPCTH
jgi:hypothetical protein